MTPEQRDREQDAALHERQQEQEIEALRADLDRATRAWWRETWNTGDLVEIDTIRVRAGLDVLADNAGW